MKDTILADGSADQAESTSPKPKTKSKAKSKPKPVSYETPVTGVEGGEPSLPGTQMPLPVVETPQQPPVNSNPTKGPRSRSKPTLVGEANILDAWKVCGSTEELIQHVKEGRVNATTAYLYQLAAVLADPYCDDDRPEKFLSYRHFRQMHDRMDRIRELKTFYNKFDGMDKTVLARAGETAGHLQHIQDSFAVYKLSQAKAFWKGFTDYATSDKPVGEIIAEAAGTTMINRYQFEIELKKKTDDLRDDWTDTLAELADSNVRVPELLWAPLPPPQNQHAWIPFPPDSNRKYSVGEEAVGAEGATLIKFSEGTAEFSGELTCNNKQHVYKLTNDDFRMISMIVKKETPVLFSVYSLELFSDFSPGKIIHSAMPDKDGVASFLLGPGTYYLRLLSWRDIIFTDAPLKYSVTMYRGQKLREHLTSGRVFVGYEQSNGSIKPFRIDFKFAEDNRITGRISWPTLLSETFFEGEYIETPQGTRLRFVETKIAKRSPFVAHRVVTGATYILEPKVYDRRFVLEGKWNYRGRSGQIRCLSAGLHDISLNDSTRKKVISQLSKDYKHTGRIEQGGELLNAEFTLVYDEERGNTSGFIYWPRHPVKDRMKQYTNGVVVDTPDMLLLRLVDTRFTARGVRVFPTNTTTFFLSPKSGSTGQGFVGRWRQGNRATGMVNVTVE